MCLMSKIINTLFAFKQRGGSNLQVKSWISVFFIDLKISLNMSVLAESSVSKNCSDRN